MSFRKLKYIICLTGLFPWILLYAQDKKEPPTRSIDVENTVQKDSIPKIELPEFVITGKEKIELPNDPKFEIPGKRLFEPLPNQPVIISDRDFSTAEITTPKKKLTVFGQDKSMFMDYLKIGYGRYNTPFGEAGIFFDYGKSKVSIQGNYIKSDGFIANSDFTTGGIELSVLSELPEYESIFNKSKINVDIDYSSDKFKFYGERDKLVLFLGYPPYPDYIIDPIINELKRTNTRFGVSSSISSFNLSFLNYQAILSYRNFRQNGINSLNWDFYTDPKYMSSIDHDLLMDENSFYAGLNLSKDLSSWLTYLESNFTYINEKRGYPRDEFLKFSETKLGVQKRFLSKFDMDLGLKYFMYRDVDQKDKFKFFPQAKLQYYITDNLSIFFNYEPAAYLNSYESANTKFKYLCENISIYHFMNNIDISFGLQFFINNISKLNFTFRYFEQENTPLYCNSLRFLFHDFSYRFFNGWLILYSNDVSKNFSGKADYYYKIDDRTDLDVSLNYNYSRIDNEKLPYIPDLVFYGDLKYESPFKLFVKPEIDIVSSRLANSMYETERSLKPYALFNIYCDYPIISNLKIFLNLENIINQKYQVYEGYDAIPFSFNFGLNFKI